MPLRLNQFTHAGLAAVYFGRSSAAIPRALEGRCARLLDEIAAATRPEDLDIPGNGFRNAGAKYLVTVGAGRSISFEWRAGQAADIDYV